MKVYRLVLADIVRDEVEENLLFHAKRLPSQEADQLVEDYRRLINLTKPEVVAYPDKALVDSANVAPDRDSGRILPYAFRSVSVGAHSRFKR